MRIHILFAIVVGLLLFINVPRQSASDFTLETLRDLAETNAIAPVAPAKTVPDFLTDLNYDQLRHVRWRPELFLWADEGLPFQLDFVHVGGAHRDIVDIHVIEANEQKQVRFSSEFFEFGNLELPGQLPDSFGFGGFRVHDPLNRIDKLDELVVFQGGTYFRALSQGTVYGLSARGVAVNTALENITEEFPVFRDFWIKKPDRREKRIEVFATMDSPSLTGAFRFDFHPGRKTTVHVTAHLSVALAT